MKPNYIKFDAIFRRSLRLRLPVLHRSEFRPSNAMSRQAGPSIVLSVLIVCFFAVTMFQRDLPCAQMNRARSFHRKPGAAPVVPSALPGTRRTPSDGPARPNAKTRANGTKTPKPAPPHAPRSAFTVTLPRETIEDVASRVYGTIDLADALWRANRDALPKRNMPLSTGMLLRTPSISPVQAQTALRK